MNLRISLLQSKKPIHQFHDEISLDWIIKNKPKIFKKNYILKDEFIRKIDKIKPWEILSDDWFVNNLIRDGIHGFRHVCRVAIYSVSLVLNNYKNTPKEEIDSLIFSGLLHDCRRENDSTDLGHGKKSAIWLSKNQDLLPEYLLKFFPAIRFSIYVHNDSYKNIRTLKNYQKFKKFVDVLKTADALDRYRFPRSDWWISPNFISLKPTIEEMAFAFDFVLISEKLFLETKNNLTSIFKAWRILKKQKI